MIPVLQQLEQTLTQPADKATQMQDLLCGLLQVILIKVGGQI